MVIKNEFEGAVTSSNELQDVYDFVREILGDDIISFKQFRAMHDKNPNISHRLIHEASAQTSIVGFASFSFLDKNNFEQLCEGKMQTLELNGDHQVSPGISPHAVYIGAIGARNDRMSKYRLVHYVDSVLANYREKFNPVFLAKPVTSEGHRFLMRRQFKPVKQLGINSLYMS